MSDYISRADAMSKCKDAENKLTDEAERKGVRVARFIIGELPSADAEFADLPDIPRAYYERIVGNMAHEINMLKEQLESANAVQEAVPTVVRITMSDGSQYYLEHERDAIQADAVHGEWEHWGSPFSDESEVIDTIVCSVCGARFIEPKDEPKGEYNYCPNCGARMKGGAEE